VPAFSRTIGTHNCHRRLDRAIQYSETAVMESTGRGVLDAPVKPGHDSGACDPAFAATAVQNPATVLLNKAKRSSP
jgi:hypothetical protein